MITARTCAMAFNRIVDRKFDAANPRTKNRHLPAGKISLGSAWALCLLSGALFVGAAYGIDWVRAGDHSQLTCLMLSPVALVFILGYSLTKRFTDFTHVFLGIALGWHHSARGWRCTAHWILAGPSNSPPPCPCCSP